ncbi:hypothetical protein COV20_04570 [Candidatus Woesearchaeota archaeon CG10_big_fil_rev_8_21_14_0_10_45_16]|nr:MAG: hypothetical protein COV20_04570 [Candidatus Woesearchaeota archaeon CG10_big_fil_rev_8_21_14_0_10_45_16]
MKYSRKVELREKGWSSQEIHKAEKALEEASRHDIAFSRMIFWSALLLTVVANFLVTAVLIPFLAFFEPWTLYVTMSIIALMIGFVYNFLLSDIAHIEARHHILAGIIVPVIAIGNVVLMIFASDRLLSGSDIVVTEDPWTLAGVFVAAFLLPYLLGRLRYLFKERRKVLISH